MAAVTRACDTVFVYNLLDLPDEILLLVFKHLRAVRDVPLMKFVCRKFNDVSKLDPLWKHFCQKDFGISDDQLWDGWRYAELYQIVLFPFRFMLGWWRRNLTYYGGLFNILVERDGIHCYECLPPFDACFLSCHQLQPYIDSGRRTTVNDDEYSPDNPDVESLFATTDDDNPSTETVSGSFERGRDDWIKILPNSDYSILARHRLRYHKVFSLKNAGKELKVYCYQSSIGLQDGIGHRTCESCDLQCRHDCGVSCGGKHYIQKTCDGIKLICENSRPHESLHFNYWFELEHGFTVSGKKVLEKTLAALFYDEHYYIRVKKLENLMKNANSYDLIPLKLCWEVPERVCGMAVAEDAQPADESAAGDPLVKEVVLAPAAPILPGLYCGSYSVHGWEILELKYQCIRNPSIWVLSASKITGDPNIPASQMSFRVFLDKPLYLTGEEESAEAINDIIESAKSRSYGLPVSVNRFQAQNFGVPSEFQERLRGAAPPVCRGRFLAEGQGIIHKLHDCFCKVRGCL